MNPLRQIIGMIAMTISLSCCAALTVTAQQREGSLFSPNATVPGDEQWDTRFGPPGIAGKVYAVAVSGQDIYVGGDFSLAGSLPAYNVARWDGKQWRLMGAQTAQGTDGQVLAIAVQGDDVYVGGSFSYAGGISVSNIARWNRSTNAWSAMGDGVGNQQTELVRSIVVGDGNVYAAGQFASAGTYLANNVARWDGTRWTRLGVGLNAEAYALEYARGSLYVGGKFTAAGGVPAGHIARWDGATWSNLGNGTDNTVLTLCASGDLLYVGGDFVNVEQTVAANYVAQYGISTQKWSPMAKGFAVANLIVPSVWGMTMMGGTLYVRGNFHSPDVGVKILRTNSIKAWNGTSWTTFDYVTGNGNAPNPYVLANDGSSLIVGGEFNVIHELHAGNIARFNGKAWMPFGTGAYSTVKALATDGRKIYLGSDLRLSEYINGLDIVHESPTNTIPSIWDGNGWSWVNGALEAGAPSSPVAAVDAIAVGSGGKVYYGGSFLKAGGITVNNIVRYDGASFSALGAGIGEPSNVNAIAVSGDEVCVGGSFSTAGGLADTNFAVWNESAGAWSNPGNVNGPVHAIAIDGNNVYIGGKFTMAGGVAVSNLAVYNRSDKVWSDVGGGVAGTVYALATGNGNLYVGGALSSAGGLPAGNVAQWIGTTWVDLDGGVNDTVRGLAWDGAQQRLFVVGEFMKAGGAAANHIAQWTGSRWMTMGGGLNNLARTVALLGSDVYVGGEFTSAGGVPSYYFGRWNRLAASAPDQELAAGGSALSIYPNPAADRMSLTVSLKSPWGGVRIEIYDVLGRQVGEVYKGALTPGEHTFSYRTEGLSDGVYVVRMQSETASVGRKMAVRH